MTKWLSALEATPSRPDGLLELAATQPSLAATWQNASRPDWLVWMAAHGFAGSNSPRDIVDATVIVADFVAEPAWRRALRLSATPEDTLRRWSQGGSDFDLGQIVAHVYLGLSLGGIAGTTGYVVSASHSLLYRELIAVAALIATTLAFAFVMQRIWVASVDRAFAALVPTQILAVAETVASDVTRRSTATQRFDGARLVRKRLAAPAIEMTP